MSKSSGKSTRPKTRHASGSKLQDYVGAGKEFDPTEVPTLRAMIQQGIFLRDQKFLFEDVAKNAPSYSKKQIAKDLAPMILAQWHKSNNKFVPPVIMKQYSLEKKIENLWQRAEDVAWGRKGKKETDKFDQDLDKLIDLTICPHTILLCEEDGSGCKDPGECKDGAHIFCSCILPNKIPRLELVWLHSQRNKLGEKSLFEMKGDDVEETERQAKALRRKENEEEVAIKKKQADEEKKARLKELQEEEDQHSMMDRNTEEGMDLEDIITSLTDLRKEEARQLVDVLLEDRLGNLASLVVRYLERPKGKNNTMPVINTAMASLRYGVSPAAAGAIASGYLQDLISAGHLPAKMAYLACDPSKIVRARKGAMARSTEKDKEKLQGEEVKGIYFDGRKDKTRALVPDSRGKMHPRIIKEEHVAVTVEPSGHYLTHFTPAPAHHPEKPAFKEAEALFEILQDLGATESCIVLGGDSTNSNTGWKGGAMAHLEKLLGHKCQWVVCNIHTLELLLKHLISSIDGPTSSKDGYTGTVGKLLSSVETMKYNPNFRALPSGEEFIQIPDEVVAKMSTDAKISYKLCHAVKSGSLPVDLQEIKCGPLSHARWLTSGERLVYMWTRDHGLTGNDVKVLETLVKFCLEMYFKMYFDIKVKHNLVDAPHHIITMLRILRKQPKQVRDVVTFYVRSGAWYAHPENVLLSLLASSESKDRKFAVDQILKARGKSEFGDISVRPRKTPKLNLSATTLTKLITWKADQVHEPVFTCSLTREEIEGFKNQPFPPPNFTSHTQSTERAVKQVIDSINVFVIMSIIII